MAELPGSYRAAFNGVDFNRYYSDVRDQFGPRFVAHVIPHRRGAKQEELGQVPVKSTFRLNFAGPSWRQSAAAVLDPMVKNPRGPLMHPIFGLLRMVLTAPVDTEFDPTHKGGLLSATLVFAEDTLTNDFAVTRGPTALAQDVSDSCATADTAAAAWAKEVLARARPTLLALAELRTTTAVNAVSAYTAAARAFSNAALEQIQLGILSPEIDLQLRQLPVLCQTAEAVLRQVGETQASFYDVVSSMEAALQASSDLNHALRATFPPPTTIRVPGRMSLHRLVDLRYANRPAAERMAYLEHIARRNRLARIDVLTAQLVIVVPAS